MWAQEYPEAEYWPLKRDQYSKGVTSSDESIPTASNTPSQFTYDILEACMRQKSFYYQVGKVYYWYSIVSFELYTFFNRELSKFSQISGLSATLQRWIVFGKLYRSIQNVPLPEAQISRQISCAMLRHWCRLAHSSG